MTAPTYNAAQIKAGAELTLAASLRAFASFDGEFSGVEQVYAGTAGASVQLVELQRGERGVKRYCSDPNGSAPRFAGSEAPS